MVVPDCFTAKTRKARKPHTCCNCRNEISSGDEYAYCSGIWDGEPNSFKSCKPCYSIMENFRLMDESLSQEDGPCFGALGCWLQDFFHASYRGVEACKDMSSIFEVDIQHIKRLTGAVATKTE